MPGGMYRENLQRGRPEGISRGNVNGGISRGNVQGDVRRKHLGGMSQRLGEYPGRMSEGMSRGNVKEETPGSGLHGVCALRRRKLANFL